MTPHGVEVFVALDPVDLRWSFDRLAGLCQERLGRDARSGARFVFYKRLDRGTFQVPEAGDGTGS